MKAILVLQELTQSDSLVEVSESKRDYSPSKIYFNIVSDRDLKVICSQNFHETNGEIVVYGRPLFRCPLSSGVFYAFCGYFVFNKEYDEKVEPILWLIERLFMNLNVTESTSKVCLTIKNNLGL